MKTGPKCRVCTSPNLEKIDNAIRAGREHGWICATYGCGGSSLTRHKQHWKERQGSATSAAPPAPEASPEIDPDAGAIDRAKAQCTRVERQLAALRATGATSREIADVERTLTGATRLLAKLTGGFEVSESMVIRSPHLARALQVIRDAIGEDLPAWRRIADALAAAEEGAR